MRASPLFEQRFVYKKSLLFFFANVSIETDTVETGNWRKWTASTIYPEIMDESILMWEKKNAKKKQMEF